MKALHRVTTIGAASAAAAAIGAASAQRSEPSKPPSIGILGTGWGLRVQVPEFRSAGLVVSAIYSRDAARAASIAETHGIDHGCDSVDSLCALTDVDIVSCVGPTSTRCEHTLTALRYGKHVLVDKPMALNEGEALVMLQAARASKVQAWMDFELRCTPAVVKLRELLSSGELGSPLHASFRCVANFGFLAGKHSHWATREQGGGVFSAVGTHFVDLTRHVTGCEVARVSATQRPLVATLPHPSSGAPMVVTSDGLCMATLEMVQPTRDGDTANAASSMPLPVSIFISGLSPGLPFQNTLTLCCERGSATLNLLDATLSVHRTDAPGQTEVYGGGGNAWSEVGTPALGRALVAALKGGQGPAEAGGIHPRDLATLEDGLIVQRVTDAVHESARRGGVWMFVDREVP